MKRTWILPLAFLFLAVAAQPGEAQENEQTAEQTQSVLDGVYTRKQATRGEQVFQQECSLCHGSAQFTGSVFLRGWTGRSANDLFEFIRTTMPFDSPGRLSREQYADIVAHMFKLNDFPTGDNELETNSEVLKRIRIIESKEK